MKRRGLLVLFGGGVAGATAYTGYDYATDTEGVLQNPPEPLSEPTPDETLSSVDEGSVTPPNQRKPFHFNEERFSEPIVDSPRFERITVHPASNEPGDRLRLAVRSPVSRSVLREIRTILGVGRQTTVESTIRDETVVFKGGTVRSQAALVAKSSAPAVLIARGGSVEIATKLAQRWPLS